MKNYRYICSILVAFLLSGICGVSHATPEIGANANGKPTNLLESELDATNTRWIRAFVHFFDVHGGKTDLATDEEIQHLKSLAQMSKYKLILSVRWDFKKNDIDIPAPNTERWYEYLTTYRPILAELAPFADIVVPTNEPMWETKSSDRVFNSAQGHIPAVAFYNKLASVTNNWRNNSGYPFKIFVGAFNRLEVANNAVAPDVVEMINFAKNNSWIDGIDVHAHHDSFADFQANFAKARQLLGSGKDIISTEFSLVALWQQKYGDKVGNTFTDQYGYPRSMTMLEYFNMARVNQVPKAEWDDLLRDKSWWPKDMFTQFYQIFDDYGVTHGTYGFKNNQIKNEIKSTDAAWFLNNIYQPAFVQPNVQGQSRHAFIWANYSNWGK